MKRTTGAPGTGEAPTGVGGRRGNGLRAGLALALALGALPSLTGEALAQERIDETRPLRSGGVLEVRTVSHDIRLVPWDRNEIRVRGECDPDREEFELRGTEGSLTVEIRQSDRRGGRGPGGQGTLEIQAPATLRLDAGSISGNIEGNGFRGTLGAGSVSGSIRLAGVRAEGVNTNSVSGSVEVSGEAPEIRVRTVSGDARVRADAGTLTAQSVSGQVTVEGTTAARRVELGAVSGRIRFTGALGPGGDLRAESHSGNVELVLNRDLGARFHLSTFSGSLRSDLPDPRDLREERARFAPGETLSFTTGDGAGRVEARTFSGSVRVGTGGR